ncbi:MAG: cupin domain-containing protein [Sphingomicrobium sp.]
MPKVDLDAIEETNRTGYPEPFHKEVAGRWYKRLAPAVGLSALGASRVRLEPGAWSSQRHWHDSEDEMVIMLAGEAVLVEDDGETLLRAGDIAAWPMGSTNGHHLINRSAQPCEFVALSAGNRTDGGYSDIDMTFTDDGRFLRRDGSEYPKRS